MKYVNAVEDIREQLQKAPQEYEERFKEILREFQELCAAEREQVVAAGGLHILGTERHEAGASTTSCAAARGRQGDPGSSRFYLSLEDDLLRIFGADRMQNAHAAVRHGGRRARSSTASSRAPSATRRRRSRRTTSTSASTCSSTTTC